MSEYLTIEFCQSYLHVQHPADYEITPVSQQQVWSSIGAACKQYKCRRVLTEAPAPPRRQMSIMDAFKSAMQAMDTCQGVSVACHFPGYKPDETTDFFTLTAENRGVRIAFFEDRDAALAWLGVNNAEQEN